MTSFFGHHRAACAKAGFFGLHWSLWALRCAEKLEALDQRDGQDLDVPEPRVDGHRLEIVVDGLPLFSGAQLAVDTAMVSPLHRDGTAR